MESTLKKEYAPILNKYISCMEEIKRRINSIILILSEQRNTGYKHTNAEFICLQFRKILELIALANLVSNKDEYANRHKNFENHYHAKHILRDIEKLNPNFYPCPTQPILEKETNRVINHSLKHGFLTKDEFLEIYNECSELMHAENPFATPKNIIKLDSKFKGWLDKITKLLNHHQIQLIDLNLQIWVSMEPVRDSKARTTLCEFMGTAEELEEMLSKRRLL